MTIPPTIHVAQLQKVYIVPEREAGLRAAVGSIFRRQHRQIKAVDGISFDIHPERSRKNHYPQNALWPALSHSG